MDDLSPLLAPELVKPAASLSTQTWENQRLLLASANAWKAAEAVPMYVAAPKMIASAASSCAHCSSVMVSTEIETTSAPAAAAPRATASATTAVWP